jgi:hypothetical protein
MAAANTHGYCKGVPEMKKGRKAAFEAKNRGQAGNSCERRLVRKTHHDSAVVRFAPTAVSVLPAFGASGAERLFSGAGGQLFACQLQLIHLPVAPFRLSSC